MMKALRKHFNKHRSKYGLGLLGGILVALVLGGIALFNSRASALPGEPGYGYGNRENLFGVTQYTSDFAVDNNGTVYAASFNSLRFYLGGSSWSLVGGQPFSPSQAMYTSVAMDNNGTPYVAYQDPSYSNKITVKRYSNGIWETVGTPGFSATAVGNLFSIAIDNNGFPYVKYETSAYPYKLIVMKYNGTSWASAGVTSFALGGQGYSSFAMDNNGTPYIAYTDNNFKNIIKKYDNVTNTWSNVGDISLLVSNYGYIPSLAIDKNGIPYVAHLVGVGNRATVYKYDGTNWIQVGGLVSTRQAQKLSLAINNNGVPCLAYTDAGGDVMNSDSWKVSVKQYDGTNRISLGNINTTPQTVKVVLKIDSNNIPYVLYHYLSMQGSKIQRFVEATPPVITAQPLADQEVFVGDTVTLSVSAEGTEPLYYQWQKDGAIVGTTNPLIFYNVQLSDAGEYLVKVSNVAGTVTSNVAQLTVTNPDRDSDGINDDVDQCPDVAGSAQFQGCPAGLRVSVQEVDAYGQSKAIKSDTALETKVFSTDEGSCAATIGAQPENYSRIYTECTAEATKNETASPSNLIAELVTIGVTEGNKLVLVQSQASIDGTHGYMGFELPAMLADQSRDVGFNVVPGQDLNFVQTSLFTRNSKGIRQSSRRSQVIKGSQLEIFQPDYVLWNGTEEVYPFLFISDSDRNVDVCLEVPEGYVVADGAVCTQAFISNEVKVVEFKVVDIGSPEKFDAGAKMTVTHKGKKTKVDLKVKSINKKK